MRVIDFTRNVLEVSKSKEVTGRRNRMDPNAHLKKQGLAHQRLHSYPATGARNLAARGVMHVPGRGSKSRRDPGYVDACGLCRVGNVTRITWHFSIPSPQSLRAEGSLSDGIEPMPRWEAGHCSIQDLVEHWRRYILRFSQVVSINS